MARQVDQQQFAMWREPIDDRPPVSA